MDIQLPVFIAQEPEPIIFQKPAEPTPKEPQLYTIVVGDTLTSISELHSVDLNRLWAANPELTDPDLIEPEKPLKIPLETDVLEPRPLPEPAIIEPTPAGVQPSHKRSPMARASSSSRNTYFKNQCVWYAKNRRPDLPNNLGSAITWYDRAKAQGLPVGSTPRVGAIGQKGNHVVYVEKVEGGRIYLSELNWDFKGSYRERWADASSFKYIY